MDASDMPKQQDAHLTSDQATALLQHWLGDSVVCHTLDPLEGGICSAVYALGFDRPPYRAVVKLQAATEDDPLPRERVRLDYLRVHTQVPCPEVYLQDDSRTILPYSFLLLERLAGVNLLKAQLHPDQRRGVEQELAEVLLELHSHARDTFGSFGEDSGERQWSRIFLPRLGDIREDMDGFLAPETLREVDRALSMAEDALRSPGKPTLVHHDVWSGNIMVEQRSDRWHLSGLLDPVGLQYADVELELAYLEAFDTVGEAFFDTYTAARPLRQGYDYRRLFYWLHTYMVHVWLGFRGDFHAGIRTVARQIVVCAPKACTAGGQDG